jgi:hypothetical protein
VVGVGFAVVLNRRERAEEPGSPAAGDDDPVAGEDLIIGQGVAPLLDPEPVDPEDLVGAAGGMGRTRYAFSGRLLVRRPAARIASRTVSLPVMGNLPCVVTVPST